ncbi:hypothetical protein WJX75_001267 [Coccomyxa subellipsoidea]|uniref:DRBM domain-containing protein n=1 Tax=Coccomyxa subellipsoidea TaxID=248742 RepID=A0ABR2Z2Z0_9CHLO
MGCFEQTTFTAWSRSKKSAEHAAAEKALAFLVSRGLMKAPPPQIGTDVIARLPKPIDIRMSEDRLRALCSQAFPGNKAAAIASIADVSGAHVELAEVDVEGLSKEELLLELKKAQQANEQLKAELALEQQRRMAVLTALIQAN